jgi:hypothetical protein
VYLDEVEVEELDEGQGWQRIESLPSLFAGD